METESFGSGGGWGHTGIQRGHLKKKKNDLAPVTSVPPNQRKGIIMSPLDLQCVQTHPCSVQYFVFS